MVAPIASGDSDSRSARTGPPASASTVFAPTARSSVLLPDMFEPLITSTLGALPPSDTLFATAEPSAISGWASAVASNTGPSALIAGNGSRGCSNAYVASDASASNSPTAVSHAASEVRCSACQRSMATAA